MNARSPGRGAARWLVRETLGTVAVCVILMVSAGRWDWVAGWTLTAIYAVWVAGTAALVMPLHPELLARRASERPERAWDRVILGGVGLLTLATYVVAGLDDRFGWGPDVPDALQWGATAGALAGYFLVAASMRANRFFTTIARVQPERGHRVATGGPYRVVRHPGYVGAGAFAACAPLVLGSWPAVPLGLLAAGLLILRTALEDRMLQAELPGYAAYAREVRWRLVPGLW